MNITCRKRISALCLALVMALTFVQPVSAQSREDPVFLLVFPNDGEPVVLTAAYVENPNGEACVVTAGSAGRFAEDGEECYLQGEKQRWEPELLEIRDDLAFFTVDGLQKQAEPLELGELEEDHATALVRDWDQRQRLQRIYRESLDLEDWVEKEHYLYCPELTVERSNIVGAPVISGSRGDVIGCMNLTTDGEAAIVLFEEVEFPGEAEPESGGYLSRNPGKKQTLTDDQGTYTGQTRDGKAQGQGTYTWKDGSRYEGSFENGHPRGSGTYYYEKNGLEQQIRRSDWIWVEEDYFMSMACQWPRRPDHPSSALLHDMEVITRDVGDYVGLSAGGEKMGHGQLKFSNGSWYIGSFLEGYPDGTGTYGSGSGRGRTEDWTWVAHETGQFVNGLEGTETAYTGMICHGEYTGFGVMGFEYCGAYFGDFEDNEPYGSGEYVYREYNLYPSVQGDDWQLERDKKVYNSKFGTFTCHVLTLDGVMEGYGISINKKKQAYVGEFENNAYGGYGVFYGPNHEYWNYGKYAGGAAIRKDK